MSNQLNLINIFKLNFRYIEILDLLIKLRIVAIVVQLKRPYKKERFRSDNFIERGKTKEIVTTQNRRAKILDAAIACEDSGPNQITGQCARHELSYG